MPDSYKELGRPKRNFGALGGDGSAAVGPRLLTLAVRVGILVAVDDLVVLTCVLGATDLRISFVRSALEARLHQLAIVALEASISADKRSLRLDGREVRDFIDKLLEVIGRWRDGR